MSRDSADRQASPPSPAYRADIDGLRAIAVLGVLLFHARFRYTPGGFVGVDVFFVISGYLITQHVVRAIEAGRFSLIDFYERRVRRIAPALLAMMLAVLLFAFATLMPEEMTDVAAAAIAATLSLSNVYFWQTKDYWSGDAHPLLHTWSLSVEEQFYILIPVLLVAVLRWRRLPLPAVLWLLFLASLALAFATFGAAPEAAFYLLPQRAWELLLGGLFGLGLVPFPAHRAGRELLALGGLAGIALVMVLPPVWQAPLSASLLACAATGLVLAVGAPGPTLAGRALAIAPLRWIGLASYSIYLWHEPVIFFVNRSTGVVFGKALAALVPALSAGQAAMLERLALVTALSLALGFLSWRWIETPFRSGRHRPPRRTLFGIAAGGAAVVVAVAVVQILGQGFPGRYPARVITVARMPDVTPRYRDGICLPGTFARSAPSLCAPLAADRPNWLVIGDSLAGRLAPGLHQTFAQANIASFSMPGCKPVPDARFGEDERCHRGYARLYRDFLPQHRVDLVILVANWQPYDLPRIARAVARLRQLGQPVAVVGPNMQYDAPMRLLLAQAILANDPGLPARHRMTAFDDLDRRMAVLARDEWQVRYFSYSGFCPAGRCAEWAAPDVPFVFDDVHMTDAASVLVARRMRETGFLP